MTAKASKGMLILVAGPTAPVRMTVLILIENNAREMESYALPIFRAGHIPILRE